MAALALGFLGTAIGGTIGGSLLGVSAATIGGFIGATAGQFIDQLLFAQTATQKGPRLSDLKVISSAYGSTIPLVYGLFNRISGNVIWSTGLIETKKTKSSGGLFGFGGSKSVNYSYRVSFALALAEGPCYLPRRIWANSKLIFDRLDSAATGVAAPTADIGMVATRANNTHSVFDTIRFYQGTGTQVIDPTIESYLGVGNVPAYRHTSYLVIKDLQLEDFGNVMPNVEVELSGQSSITSGEIVTDICTRANIASVDVSALTDDVKGYVIASDVTGSGAIGPLALVYDFDAANRPTEIVFAKRGGAIARTIPIEDMGATDAARAEPDEPFRFDRVPDAALPREASVTYSAHALRYQQNTQRAQREYGDSANNISQELPMTLSDDEGAKAATRLVFEAWAARRQLRFALSEKYLDLDPAETVAIAMPSQPQAGFTATPMAFRLTRMLRGNNGVINCEARFEDTEVNSSSLPGSAGVLPDDPLAHVFDIVWQPLDTAVLSAAEDDAGFYWAAAVESTWRGGTILRSIDGGTTYTPMDSTGFPAVIGSVASALPAGPADIWDRGNSITVALLNPDDALESADELLVLNGVNGFWLGPESGQGGEIVQFATATLTAPGVYQLSDLLRGRLGTEFAIGSHGADEVFVLLEPDTIARQDYGAGDWNKSRLYKPVPTYSDEASTASESFTNTGEGKRPLAPVHGRGTRDGSNNLTLEWVRRSRIPQPGLGNGLVPLGEESEKYEIDVMSGASVLRTITATSPSASYSAAQQTADGLTPGAAVSVNVYQISGLRGRGHAGAFTL
jgi:hypothetical protein